MNRIKRRHSDKDRVVCVSIPSKQWFYYQPARGNHRVYLFETEFSGSVFAYFRDRGRNLADRGFSLTIQELYEHHCRRNPKIDFLLRRLPGAIDRALREEANPRRREPLFETAYRGGGETPDDDIAA